MSGRPRMPQVLLAWLPAVAYMVFIWTFSSFSTASLPVQAVPFEDKGAHFVEYGILGFLIAHALRGTWPGLGPVPRFVAAVVATVVWGMLDEIHQAYVPSRQSDIYDVVADGIGALCGALLFALVHLRRDRAAGSAED